MMTTNTELYNIAKKYIGTRGKEAKAYCRLPSDANYCDAFVTWLFHVGDVSQLYCKGTIQTYCPTSIEICRKLYAQLPPYLALPMDVIFYDWEPNGLPNHVGLIVSKISTSKAKTIEGNTSGGIIDEKIRNMSYTQGIFRMGFKPKSLPDTYVLNVDGNFGYKSIYTLQHVLKVTEDCIFGRKTLMALQRYVGATPDAVFGENTARKVQKLIGAAQDGQFGEASVRKFQKWLNKMVSGQTETPTTPEEPKPEKGVNGRTILARLKAETTLELMSSMIVQSLAVRSSKERAIFYTAKNNGNTQKGKVYTDKDKTSIVKNYTSLGHSNGACVVGNSYYVCSYFKRQNLKKVSVIRCKDLKKTDSFNMPVAVSGIGYDRITGTLVGSKGSTVYIFDKSRKVKKKFKLKFKDGTPQDINAHDGKVYVCRSHVTKKLSAIDTYDFNGKYQGSYIVPNYELESCDIDENNKLHYATWNQPRLIKTTTEV